MKLILLILFMLFTMQQQSDAVFQTSGGSSSVGITTWPELVATGTVPADFADGIDNTTTGAGGGTLTTIKKDNAALGASDVVSLDFLGDGFDCTRTGSEVDCSIATAIARGSDVAAHSAETLNIHGIANTALLLQATSIDTSAEINTIVTDQSGSGQLLFSGSPLITTPNLVLENAAGAPPIVDGRLKYDRTLERLQVGDGVGTKSFVPVGTLNDAMGCIWNNTAGVLECNTAPAGSGTDPNAIHSTVAGEINALTDKALPVPADRVVLEDSESAPLWQKRDAPISALPISWLQLADIPPDIANGDDVATPVIGNPTIIPGDDPCLNLSALTAGESLWWLCVNHNTDGLDNDSLLIQQSATLGSEVRMEITVDGTIRLPASTDHGGEYEWCEDADMTPSDCVVWAVEDGKDLPPGETRFNFDSNGRMEPSAIAGVHIITTSKAASYPIGADDAAEPYGGVLYATAAMTYTAPLAAPGMSFSVLTVGNVAVSVDVNIADSIVLDGVLPALAPGFKINNTSSAGDMAVCTYMTTNTWYCATGSNDGDPWTSGGGS